MGRTYDTITDRLTEWVRDQPVFFVATAPLSGDGLVNCSPKRNRDELRVLDGRTVAYVDQTGSGVETIAHLRENGRMVVMLCAFCGPPRIVRFHGTGRAMVVGTDEFACRAGDWPAASAGPGVRSIVVLDVDRISDSCGYGVPLMDFRQHRPVMDRWADRKGPDGIREYWAEKNQRSLDGLPGLDLAPPPEPRRR